MKINKILKLLAISLLLNLCASSNLEKHSKSSSLLPTKLSDTEIEKNISSASNLNKIVKTEHSKVNTEKNTVKSTDDSLKTNLESTNSDKKMTHLKPEKNEKSGESIKDHKKDNESQINPAKRFTTDVKDFFKKTSKNNQNMAWEALSAFVGGIILWFVSICLTCWNEKRAVRIAELADYINDDKKVVFVDDGNPLSDDKIDSSKAYMVTGKLHLISEAKVDNLNIDIKSDFGQILITKLKVEKFSKTVVYEERDARDSHGNDVTEVSEKTYRNWNEVTVNDENGPATKYFYGSSLIGGVYRFDSSKLNHLLTGKQNSAYYDITDSDNSALQDYFKIYFKNSKFFIRSKSLFVISSNPHINDSQFNPQTFDFTIEDYKISLIYYYLPRNVESYFTAIGALSTAKDGVKEIGSFETDIKNAEFCYLCCCCEDSSYMKIDTVLTTKMTRQKYYEEINSQNTTNTWLLRLLCFLLHFASYYLILYPIIMIVGMIPFLGAIGATVLIFVAFLIALVTFLFVIALAWICARPLRAIILFGIIGILIFVGKTSSDHIKAQYDNNEKSPPASNNFSTNLKFL